MSTIRRTKQRFVAISNDLAQDSTLSFECRGLLLYLLSKPDDWQCKTLDIEREGNIKRDQRRRIMKEAEQAGYLTFTQTRDSQGRFISEYWLHEEAVPNENRTQSWLTGAGAQYRENGGAEQGFTDSRKPDIGFPDTRNAPSLQTTDLQTTDLQTTDKTNPPSLHSGADAPIFDEKPKRKSNPLYDLFASEYEKAKGCPYVNQTADFVQFANLKKKLSEQNWELTADKFAQACRNYFLSPVSKHTLADLACRFATFYAAPLDRFKVPVEVAGNGAMLSSKTSGNMAAAKRAAERIRAEYAGK